MQQLTLAIKFTAPAEKREEFKQILTDLFITISNEKNFVNATIHEGIQNINEFLVYETWNDNLGDFLSIQMKKPYAVQFESTLDALKIVREPAAYSPFAHFGTHKISE
ncbi:Quinol monooxygenase YgiN [Pedobacter westerhofensis]|uniref:Quinol monooxygenase YgiN n=1 Tax=Pedobacter westerhofensis TaxID=425512 RepID=A0A521EBK6_9SPHI|nr:antibiotic biosynthesis monooxygenase [Pedobacter westerhofensis]SMO80841.1 Quinol monooxygenase YgiN [Pedobacter westerhofensis]